MPSHMSRTVLNSRFMAPQSSIVFHVAPMRMTRFGLAHVLRRSLQARPPRATGESADLPENKKEEEVFTLVSCMGWMGLIAVCTGGAPPHP